MDERKQYVPTFTNTYNADLDAAVVKPETIVEAAIDKETDYKNTTDLPVEGAVNFKEIQHKR